MIPDWGDDWIAKEIHMDNCTNLEELLDKTVRKLDALREKAESKIA